MENGKRSVWNRMVNPRLTEREQSHKTPVNTTCRTTDYMTRVGGGTKTMGDCLTDKVVPWKTHWRLVSLCVTVDMCRSGVREEYVTNVSREGMCTVGLRQYIRTHGICVIPIRFLGSVEQSEVL
jgi:hypothetical protein